MCVCVCEREEKSKTHIRSFATPFSLIRFAISKMIIAYELFTPTKGEVLDLVHI